MPYRLLGNSLSEFSSKADLQSDAIEAWYGYKERKPPTGAEEDAPARIVAIWSVAPLSNCTFASVSIDGAGDITEIENDVSLSLAAMRAFVNALPPNGNFLELTETDYDAMADTMFPA